MTKEELRKFYSLRREADQLRDEVAELKAIAASCGGGLNGMPRAPGAHSKVEDLVIRIDEAVSKYEARIIKIIDLQIRIEEAIERLPTAEQMLIRYRYLDGLTWEEVCVRLGYAWSQTHRLHAKALKDLTDK